MLASIHPLGERARHNRWLLTTTAYLVGSTAAAGLLGGLLGVAGATVAGAFVGGAGRGAVAGATVVGTFGLVRAMPVPLVMGRVHRPQQLRAVHRSLAAVAP